ncbi:MAG: hypothetical protein RLZZ232_2200, partial [Planctomycetota bacterium]|jgi:hypothetical protein
MDAGAVPHTVYSLVHEQVSMSRLRMGGRILGRATAEAEGRLVWVQVEARDSPCPGQDVGLRGIEMSKKKKPGLCRPGFCFRETRL